MCNQTPQEEHDASGTTKIIESHHHGPSAKYIHCNSKSAYIPSHPSSDIVNQSLNLHLGLPFEPRNIYIVRKACKILSDLLALVEVHLFRGWEALPLRFRQSLTSKAWRIYFPIHRWLLSNKTGIHRDASLEYHALTSILYWGRLFPVTIRRMRMSLSQISVCHGHDVYPILPPVSNVTVERVHFQPRQNHESSISLKEQMDIPIQGYWIHNHKSEANGKVLFYLYGGAYLSGDCEGNIPFAKKISELCNMSVFLPSYRLLPEYSFFDSFQDVIAAYEYLVFEKGVDSKKVTLLGISSGGGLCVRLMQRIQLKNRVKCMMPNGAVLFSPFVEYTTPKGSFKDYIKHDLIVNESVFEEGIPYFSTLGGEDSRHNESPVNIAMEGLPPLCILVSEHECCYDQNILLCNRAREAGVKVDLGVWKYMCHVWPVMCAFLPEGRSAVDFVCNWIHNNSHTDATHDEN
jgi:acetyl esterase/lipase